MMNRRTKDLPMLGFGCMRLPKKGKNFDIEASKELISYAIDHGIDYFDTAYIYPGNEKAMGQILEELGKRQEVHIATKMPHYLIRNINQLENVFQEQLKRLRTDYVDSYLMHMLPDVQIWEKLVRMGVLDWLLDKKAKGQIRKIGFSYHGNTENFVKLLDAYDWEFCQVQYNYMDENSQAGREGVKRAYEKGIPVIIMEPLRGGKLVNNLPEKAMKAFSEADIKRSPAEWGLRWLWDQKEIACILSGMNSMEMLKENIRIAEHTAIDELTEKDFQMYETVKEAIGASTKVPCTGCGYCQPCPFGVDIPGSFRCYNAKYIDGWFTGLREYMMVTTFRAERTNASLCRKCGKCEQHCPQNIKIRHELDQVVKHMEGPVYKVTAFFAKFFFRK